MAAKIIGGCILAIIALMPGPVSAMDKPLFIGEWQLSGVDVTCGTWPRTLPVTEADSTHIVMDGKTYPVSGLPGHPPHDRENQIITKDIDFVIMGDDKKSMILSFKDAHHGQCLYRRS